LPAPQRVRARVRLDLAKAERLTRRGLVPRPKLRRGLVVRSMVGDYDLDDLLTDV
jgi:hypothetical protein